MILRFSLNKHLLNTSSSHCALAIQVPRVSVDESEFTGWDDKVQGCVRRTRTILNVISSTTKNKNTHKMINATSNPAVLWRCLGSAKDREEGISQAPALMSPHCSNSVPGKNLHWIEETCSSPVCVGRSLCSSLKCGQYLPLLTAVMMAEHLWWVFCLLGLKWPWVSRRPRKRLPTVDSCNYWNICVFEGLSTVPVGKL